MSQVVPEKEKYTSNAQINDLHTACHISKTSIEDILAGYRQIVIQDLEQGNEFRFGYLAKVVVTGQQVGKEKTLAHYSSLIGQDLNLPRQTVQGVLRAYVKLTINQILQGKSYNLVSILILKPVIDEVGNLVNITVELSHSLSRMTAGTNIKLRAKILRNIRYYISEQGVIE